MIDSPQADAIAAVITMLHIRVAIANVKILLFVFTLICFND
jgi:hypothetical protein